MLNYGSNEVFGARPRTFETTQKLSAHRRGARLQPPVACAGRDVRSVSAAEPYALAEQREFFVARSEADANARLGETSERAILRTIGA